MRGKGGLGFEPPVDERVSTRAKATRHNQRGKGVEELEIISTLKSIRRDPGGGGETRK